MGISEIKDRYGIESDDVKEIRTVLRKKLGAAHPDNNDGKCDVDYFECIKRDLEYLEQLIESENKKPMIPVEDVMNYMVDIIQNRQNVIVSQEEKSKKELSDIIDNQISSFKFRFRTKKYSLTTVTSVLTFLWMFPENIINHPVIELWNANISFFSQDKIVLLLSIVWLLACLITLDFWLATARAERIEKQLLEMIKLETFQNEIFERFTRCTDRFSFSKSEFIDFILHEIYDSVRYGRRSFGVIFRVKVFVGKEIVEGAANIILNRAIECNIIQKNKELSLIDYYCFIER